MTKQIAKLNYLRMAPRKVRLVGDVIRGLSVNEAEAQLLLERRRAAKPLLKLLRSAVQNAKNNRQLNQEKLYVENVRVDQGPMLKRSLPRARGSASLIQKKMSHVTLTLAESEKLLKPRFTITVQKKVKLPPESRSRARKQEKKVQGEIVSPRAAQKSPGFFKRFFRRKSV
jgi:large subunit ribosomal protein L22